MSEEFAPALLPMTLEAVFTSADPAFGDAKAVSRDLGLGTATDKIFNARRVRLGADGSIQAVATDTTAWFTFIYILDGQAVVAMDSGEVTLRSHDAVSQVPFTGATLRSASPFLEFLEIQAADSDEARKILPHRPRQTISFDSPEAHDIGVGPRSFFDYRNLGVAESTDRLIEIQVVRAQRPKEGGTGWHSHDMAQLTYGLKGWGMLDVEGVAGQVCHRPGDGVSIPAHWRHNASSFSSDYWALQLQIPADYRTFVREAPAPGNRRLTAEHYHKS